MASKRCKPPLPFYSRGAGAGNLRAAGLACRSHDSHRPPPNSLWVGAKRLTCCSAASRHVLRTTNKLVCATGSCAKSAYDVYACSVVPNDEEHSHVKKQDTCSQKRRCLKNDTTHRSVKYRRSDIPATPSSTRCCCRTADDNSNAARQERASADWRTPPTSNYCCCCKSSGHHPDTKPPLVCNFSRSFYLPPPPSSLTGADVVPVLVVGAHLLVGSGLDQVAPRGQLDATGVLEVLGVSLDEVSRGDIAHGDPSGLVVRHGA